jgi:hypothetical protein
LTYLLRDTSDGFQPLEAKSHQCNDEILMHAYEGPRSVISRQTRYGGSQPAPNLALGYSIGSCDEHGVRFGQVMTEPLGLSEEGRSHRARSFEEVGEKFP